MMPISSCTPFPFSTQCDDMLTMHVCATHWLSMYFYTLAYMSMHESCLLECRPCFNTMKLKAFDPNLHLSLVDTTFHLLSCLFAFSLICLLSCFFACHIYHAYLLYAFHVFFASFPSITCLLVSCLCLCMYTHGTRTHGARVWSPRRKQKGGGCEHVDTSQTAMFSSFKGLAPPIWLCTLLRPLPSSSFSLLDGLY